MRMARLPLDLVTWVFLIENYPVEVSGSENEVHGDGADDETDSASTDNSTMKGRRKKATAGEGNCFQMEDHTVNGRLEESKDSLKWRTGLQRWRDITLFYSREIKDEGKCSESLGLVLGI